MTWASDDKHKICKHTALHTHTLGYRNRLYDQRHLCVETFTTIYCIISMYVYMHTVCIIAVPDRGKSVLYMNFSLDPC